MQISLSECWTETQHRRVLVLSSPCDTLLLKREALTSLVQRPQCEPAQTRKTRACVISDLLALTQREFTLQQIQLTGSRIGAEILQLQGNLQQPDNTSLSRDTLNCFLQHQKQQFTSN